MPSMPTSLINPLKHSAVFAGHIIVGPAEGTWLSLEQGAEAATKTVGAYGDVTYTFTADTSATVTVRLKQDSPSNRVLHRMADLKTVGAFEFKDMNNPAAPVVARAAFATIATRPALARGAEENINEWTFHLDATQQEV